MSSLSVDIEHCGVYVPSNDRVVIRHEFGSVVMFVDSKRVDVTTIAAHGVGMSIFMAMKNISNDELFNIKINGESLRLLAPVAQKVASALLRKADDADDWQLKFNKRIG